MRDLLRCTLIVTLLLAGCATQAEKQAAATAHYTAQASFVTTTANAQKPACEFEGINGKEISLSGIKSFKCWGGNTNTAQFQAAPVEPNAMVQTLQIAKELTLGIAPIYLGAKVLTTMGKISSDVAAGRGPVTTTNTTTTTSNANVSNANQANQANSANVTSTTGNNSVIGSGSSSTPTTSTVSNTTSTDSHPVTTTTNTTSTDSHPVTTSTTTNSQHGTCTTGTC